MAKFRVYWKPKRAKKWRAGAEWHNTLTKSERESMKKLAKKKNLNYKFRKI